MEAVLGSLFAIVFYGGLFLLFLAGPIIVILIVIFLMIPKVNRFNDKKASPEDESLFRGTPPHEEEKELVINKAIITTKCIVAAVVLGLAFYSLITRHNMEQTAALFIGLPTVLSLAVTFSPRTDSFTILIFKAITIALLMSFVLSFEGYLCILMSAPLFYVIGLFIGILADFAKSRLMRSCVLLLLCLMSLEGVSPGFTFKTDEIVTVTKTIPVSAELVETRVSGPPDFSHSFPVLAHMGFPKPIGSELDDETGNIIVHFTGSENRPPGDLLIKKQQIAKNTVHFDMLSDTSHIEHWLSWKSADVSWQPISETETEVTWTIEYERSLHPAWYFAPLERYFVNESAHYFVDSLQKQESIEFVEGEV